MNSNQMDSFLDGWVVMIGNRIGSVVLIAVVAMWKDGENLRYWGAFFVLNIHLDFQVMFGLEMAENAASQKPEGES